MTAGANTTASVTSNQGDPYRRWAQEHRVAQAATS